MKPTPLFLILARLARLRLPQQIFLLRAMIAQAPPRSVRRQELESLLTAKVARQLRKEERIAS